MQQKVDFACPPSSSTFPLYCHSPCALAVQPIEHLPHVAVWQAFEYVGCGAALKSNNGNYANCKWSSSSNNNCNNQLGQQWEASQGSLPPISRQHSLLLPPQVLPVGNRISAEQKLQTGEGRGERGGGRLEVRRGGGRQRVAWTALDSVAG